jgi:uncharacterized protein (TIGR00251 family)
MSWYRWDGPDLVLEVRVQPRAKRDEFSATAGGRLKVRLAAPPVDGKANAALITFLAKAFAVPRSAVTLEKGIAARDKRLRVCEPRAVPLTLSEAGLSARAG